MIRHQLSNRLLFLTLAMAFFASYGWGQDQRPARERALDFLQHQYLKLGLSQQDVADTRVTDDYVSRHNGVQHVWIQQQHLGIPVFNGLIGLHITPEGNVFYVGHRFTKDLKQKANTGLPSLSASKALELAMSNIGFSGFPTPSVKIKTNERNWVFQGGAVSKSEIPVSACYTKTAEGELRLSWQLTIDQANTPDIWTICIDAVTGLVLHKSNMTVYCNVGFQHEMGDRCVDHAPIFSTDAVAKKAQQPSMLLDEQYNVFALPVESPAYGNRSIVTNPHDPAASPYGWLDTNMIAGPEFEYTRGNNVWAFDDSPNDNTPDPTESAFAGPTLNFDFPFDPNLEPYDNSQAAITNLFYLNNMMHDISHRFGFDEEAGNFQYNNYSELGKENDPVSANALDGGGTNNANFATPPDGFAPRMQMFVWNQQSGNIVKVNAPGIIAGTYFAGQGGWGGDITTDPLTADVVFINDDIEPTIGCEPPLNDLTGKIVMVDRGVCEFGFKALTVQEAGGVACIICDHESPPKTGFGEGASGGAVTIPAIWMKKADCALLRQHAGAGGLNISIVVPGAVAGPAELDGDFDNGVIAHEYGHGISNRLTGGPANTGCLSNAEQMGEGWSDFFALALTVRPGDSGATKRGIANYAFRKPLDSGGLRRYPYSTDMSVNPLTFATVAENPEVHALGEIWTAMTWDLYWALVEKYGYDADLSNPNSGNARAIQLVMDGMKLQPCGPGFVDGRDAIMKADAMYYGGADTCLISTVFARRGLGYLASQEDPAVATDGIENFDPIPVCVKELKINKEALTPIIEAGGTASFRITITNHKDDAAPNVVVTDILPAGLSLVSASNGGTASNGVVTWNLGTVASGQVVTLTYDAVSANNLGSILYFVDPMDTEDNWAAFSLNQTNIELFELQSVEVQSGTAAWRGAARTDAVTDYVLESVISFPVTGAKPALRFWHKYDTEPSADAGFLEFLDEGAPNPVWKRVTNDATFRAGYDGKVAYGTFALPNHYGFSGNSNGWIQSYFDMSAYKDKTIKIRFRFGTDDNTGPVDGFWAIDELQLVDMFNYDSEACVTSGADQACDQAEERGVIVNPAKVATEEPGTVQVAMNVQPNPSSDFLYISIAENLEGAAVISLVGIDGRPILEKNLSSLLAGQSAVLDVKDVPAGVYFVQLQSAKYRSNVKVVVR